MMLTASQYLELVHDLRRQNLERITTKIGSQVEAARQMGMDKCQLCNILGGRLTVSELRARKAEQFLGLEFGALDQPVGGDHV